MILHQNQIIFESMFAITLLAFIILIHRFFRLKAYAQKMQKDYEEKSALIAAHSNRLFESEERFRSLEENIDAVFWIVNLYDGAVAYISSAFERIWNLNRESQLKDYNYWVNLVHPDDRDRVTHSFRTKAIKGEFDEEYRVCLPDGRERWVRDRGFPIHDANGEVARIAGIAEDITERKYIEEERVALLERERSARLEAEHAGHMKDEFLATLSHELRTPLNAMIGWVDLIKQGKIAKEDLPLGLDILDRNARIQAHLIEDLLDMSRIIAGKVRLDAQPVKLIAVIDAAIASVQPSAEIKNIRIEKIMDVDVDCIKGDYSRLQQVIWNLLTNAIKFTPKAGHVQIILTRVDTCLELTVKDSGRGITAEFLPYVFERFRQADPSTTRRFGGLGLGLAIVKQLVELHGGSVTVTSPGINQGSSFTVSLPMLERNESGGLIATAPEASCASTFLSNLNILVVDDDPDALDLFHRMLTKQEANVITATSAKEALDIFEQKPPDILISDIALPDQDGYDLIRQVRKLPAERGGKTPALAVTAFARTEDRDLAISAGYQNHLPKPVQANQLVTVLSGLVEHG